MKKALVYFSVVAASAILFSSCRSHGGDCPAYGMKKTTEVQKAQHI